MQQENLVWFLMIEVDGRRDMQRGFGFKEIDADFGEHVVPAIGYRTPHVALEARACLLRELWGDDVSENIVKEGGDDGYFIRIEAVTLPE